MEYYRVEDVNKLRSTPAMSYMLRLMMSSDAMRSSVRWLELLSHGEKTGALVLDTDWFINMITSAGWTTESLKLVRQGALAGFVRREMLNGHDDLLQLWDDALIEPDQQARPEYLKRIWRIRNKYFAHWDDKAASAFIEWQASGGETVAFMESDQGVFLKSSYPWVNVAVVRHLLSGTTDIQAWKEVVSEIGPLVGRICNMTSYLTLGILTDHDITLVQFDPGDR